MKDVYSMPWLSWHPWSSHISHGFSSVLSESLTEYGSVICPFMGLVPHFPSKANRTSWSKKALIFAHSWLSGITAIFFPGIFRTPNGSGRWNIFSRWCAFDAKENFPCFGWYKIILKTGNVVIKIDTSLLCHRSAFSLYFRLFLDF